jgi:hypothetical protein
MEGPKKAAKAERIRDRMRELCPTTLIANEKIPDKKLSYSGVWNEINDASLFWTVWLLKALLQDEGDVIDLDGNDWRTATAVGRYTVPGFFDASRGLEGFEKGLLGNPYLDSRIVEKARAIVFWFEGTWSVEDHERIVDCVQRRIKHSDRDQELELKWGIRERGVPDGQKTVGFVAFAEEGPDVVKENEKEVLIPVETELDRNTSEPEHDVVFATTTLQNEEIARGKRKTVRLVINNNQVESLASEELVTRLEKFYSRGISSNKDGAWSEFREIRTQIHIETGHTIDTPTWLSLV